jgi:hypothetical protein
MAFKGKANKGSGDQWYGGNTSNDGSVVYGKLNGSWLHAKQVQAKKDGVWSQVWLDCREHDAGGSGWTPETLAAVYSGTCGGTTYQIPTRYTKTGCPTYTRNGTTVSDPFCYDGASHLGSNDCYDASTVAAVYFDGSCGTRRLRTATTTVPKTTSGCGSTTYYGSPYSSPDCNKYDTGCYNAATAEYVYQLSCTSRERRVKYTFTPKANTSCDVQYAYSDWEASPDCGSCGGACWADVTETYFAAYGFFNLFAFAGLSYYIAPGDTCDQKWAVPSGSTGDPCYVNGGYTGVPQSRLRTCGTSQCVSWNGVCGGSNLSCVE